MVRFLLFFSVVSVYAEYTQPSTITPKVGDIHTTLVEANFLEVGNIYYVANVAYVVDSPPIGQDVQITNVLFGSTDPNNELGQTEIIEFDNQYIVPGSQFTNQNFYFNHNLGQTPFDVGDYIIAKITHAHNGGHACVTGQIKHVQSVVPVHDGIRWKWKFNVLHIRDANNPGSLEAMPFGNQETQIDGKYIIGDQRNGFFYDHHAIFFEIVDAPQFPNDGPSEPTIPNFNDKLSSYYLAIDEQGNKRHQHIIQIDFYIKTDAQTDSVHFIPNFFFYDSKLPDQLSFGGTIFSSVDNVELTLVDNDGNPSSVFENLEYQVFNSHTIPSSNHYEFVITKEQGDQNTPNEHFLYKWNDNRTINTTLTPTAFSLEFYLRFKIQETWGTTTQATISHYHEIPYTINWTL